MASSRDDFIIAIRSAFLKKSTQQKFSLSTLILISLFTIILSNYDFKIIRYAKIGINEVVYRSSFIVSIPENFIKNTFLEINEYTTFFKKYKKDQNELNKLRSENISNEIIQNENRELKELINDYVSSSEMLLAKIIVDHNSPFLKSIIINKGSKDNVKIGTNIFDKSYLVGRVIEVNYRTSRVLLLSDLNSNVPVTIAPQNVQAIITGSGTDFAQIKYIKEGIFDEFTEQSIIYSSGTGAIFKSGIPIGRLKSSVNEDVKEYNVEFYSDFSQLKYVFADVGSKIEIIKVEEKSNNSEVEDKTPLNAKLKILEDELRIIEDSNLKFQGENDFLKTKINELNINITILKNEIINQKKIINQIDIDKEELKFLRLNLLYSHKCQTRKLFSTGYKIGTPEYKKCILNKGKIDD